MNFFKSSKSTKLLNTNDFFAGISTSDSWFGDDPSKKLDNYIAKAKKAYQRQYDDLSPLFEEWTAERKKLYQQIEELQISNELMKNQREMMEQQLRQRVTQDTEPNGDEKQKEEVTRLQIQVSQICEEMRRLQEDNDDLNVALDAEKRHKDKILQQKNQLIDDLQGTLNSSKQMIEDSNLQIQKLVLEVELFKNTNAALQSEMNNLRIQNQEAAYNEQIKITRQSSYKEEDVILRIKDLESKLIQERIKVDQYQRDMERINEKCQEQRQQVEDLFAINTKLESRVKLLEEKRVRDKQNLQDQKQRIKEISKSLQEYQMQFINARDSHEKAEQNLKQHIDQSLQLQTQLNDTQIRLTQLNQEKDIRDEQILLLIQRQIENLQKSLISLHNQNESLLLSNNQLQSKREFAIQEIERLTQCLNAQATNIKTLREKSVKGQEPEIPQNKTNRSLQVEKEKVKVRVLPVLLKHINELKKLLEHLYKEFVQALSENKIIQNIQGLLTVEKKINDCNRKCFDIIDIFEDLGVQA